MKKIVIVGPAFPYRGGNSLFISHLYSLLADKFDVSIVNYKLLYPSFLFPGTTQYDNSKTVIKQAPSERLVNSVNPFNWYTTARRIAAMKPDAVLFDWWHPFFGPCHTSIARLVKSMCRTKIVFIAENFTSHEGSPVDKMLTRLGLSNADAFLALSDKVAGEVAEVFSGRPIMKAELPVYDCYTSESPVYDRANFGFSTSDKVLLFFGYIRRYKGLDILLKALSMLVKKDPSYRLLAVGESYEDPEIYRKLIGELKIENFVRFENVFTPNEEVWKYYTAADVVVLPYRSATQSGILNIAYGFLKPVIITNVGGLAEFIDPDRTGLLVEPESAESLAEGIEKFFSLRGSLDFTKHIQERLGKNLFYEIPAMMEDFLG